MGFTTDQQTLDDLNLFGRNGAASVYAIFDRTNTRKGSALLEDMFRHPLSDAVAINRRSSIFKYFAENTIAFPFQRELFDMVELYLSITDERTRLSGERQNIIKQLTGLIGEDNDYNSVYKAVTALGLLFHDLQTFLNQQKPGSPYKAQQALIEELLNTEIIQALLKESRKGKMSFVSIAEHDSNLRFRHRETLRRLLQHIYQLDVYISVGSVARASGFVFGQALPADTNRFSLQGMYHPQVKQAVPNTLEITANKHVLFLTGANMAGKSTFMKTLGICLFLAHMGFPLPAASVEFSVLDGIYTSINLPDNLGLGVSHFFAEVQRIKKIAGELKHGKRLLVIFDELFRGTNVKDAYDATVALTAAFANRRDSILVLSTHIIEAGETLGQQSNHIDFIFLPTRMEGGKPFYPYTLERGITDDRHGMVIIRNEGLLDLLHAGPATTDPENSRKNQIFNADAQTLEDLNITGKFRPGSVFRLFNVVKTDGGERLLEERFRQPITDPQEINRRTSIFLHFKSKQMDFPFTREQLKRVEEYLRTGAAANRWAVSIGTWKAWIMQAVTKEETYGLLAGGIRAMLGLLHDLRQWLKYFENDPASPINALLSTANNILSDQRLQRLPAYAETEAMSWREIGHYHHLLGYALHEEMESLCHVIYAFDLAIAVGNVARQKGFTFPKAVPKSENILSMIDLRHPALDQGVGNEVRMSPEHNVIFLTGANMAGKSTLMKSFGIAIYLAHMGFPVAAREMVFSVKDALYSSINVPDDLSLGYSHFYAEVRRVKQVADELHKGKHLVVIFDELFKGTNVKDAYDATLSVTATFTNYQTCWFMISTHITEVGEALHQNKDGLQFRKFSTILQGSVPKNTYLLDDGISTDRHGMLIISNEGILEIIKG